MSYLWFDNCVPFGSVVNRFNWRFLYACKFYGFRLGGDSLVFCYQWGQWEMDYIIQITWRGGKKLISWFGGVILWMFIQLLVFKKVSGILWGDRLETWHWLVRFSSNVLGNPFILLLAITVDQKLGISVERGVFQRSKFHCSAGWN